MHTIFVSVFVFVSVYLCTKVNFLAYTTSIHYKPEGLDDHQVQGASLRLLHGLCLLLREGVSAGVCFGH